MFVYEPRILGFGGRRGMTAALKEGSLGRDFGLSGCFGIPTNILLLLWRFGGGEKYQYL